MSRFLLDEKVDFPRHNEEVRRLWKEYEAGSPARAPVTFSMNFRMVVQNPELNPTGWTFRDVFERPEVRWEVELSFAKWVRFNIPQDAEMGSPSVWPGISLSLLNCDEAAWFGCPIVFSGSEVPFVQPILNEKKDLLRLPVLDGPFSGALGRWLGDQYEWFERKRSGEVYEGIPVGRTAIPLSWTDGPFTVACNLRGASNLACDLYDDPAFVDELLSFITDATIRRMRECRKLAGRPLPEKMFGFADDAIEWLSPPMYERFVLPHHRRIVEEFRGEKNLIHLCGDPAHLFPTIVNSLGVRIFDLGFPTDMGEVRKRLGPDITLIGNIAPHLLLSGPPQAIREAVKQLCSSGVMEAGRFILHDGNNCVPLTPVAHFRAMYEAGKEFGVYRW